MTKNDKLWDSSPHAVTATARVGDLNANSEQFNVTWCLDSELDDDERQYELSLANMKMTCANNVLDNTNNDVGVKSDKSHISETVHK